MPGGQRTKPIVIRRMPLATGVVGKQMKRNRVLRFFFAARPLSSRSSKHTMNDAGSFTRHAGDAMRLRIRAQCPKNLRQQEARLTWINLQREVWRTLETGQV
jgi:hypothetical protein